MTVGHESGAFTRKQRGQGRALKAAHFQAPVTAFCGAPRPGIGGAAHRKFRVLRDEMPEVLP